MRTVAAENDKLDGSAIIHGRPVSVISQLEDSALLKNVYRVSSQFLNVAVFVHFMKNRTVISNPIDLPSHSFYHNAVYLILSWVSLKKCEFVTKLKTHIKCANMSAHFALRFLLDI